MTTMVTRGPVDLETRNRRVVRVLLAIIAALASAAFLVGIFKR